MNRGSTKRGIPEAALDLFSAQGFEATSVSQIASAVGIRRASHTVIKRYLEPILAALRE